MDVVNAGIALFRSGEDKIKVAVTDFEKKFEELKAKGELDQSEQAKKLRDLLNKTIVDAKEVINKTNSSYGDVVSKLQTNFQSIQTQIETSIPQDVKDRAKNALEELKKLVSQKTV